MNFRQYFEMAPPGKDKIFIFDFDDTLVHTTKPEEGIPTYEKSTGKPWIIKDDELAKQHGFDPKFKRSGWWHRAETLEPPVFNNEPEKLNKLVANAFSRAKNDGSAYVVVMTGRNWFLEKPVKEILSKYGIHADEYYFKDQKDLLDNKDYPRGDTYAYKEFVFLNKLINNQIKSVEIWEDRDEHIVKFIQLGNKLKEKWPQIETFIVHDAKTGKNYQS